jgi:o-succinylbenzoate synthase
VRIVEARAWPIRLEFLRPVRTSAGEFRERRSVLLALTDADGRTGYGEAAPWPGFGTETVEQSLATLETTCGLVPGTDLEAGDWPVEVALNLRNASAARAAFQGALWDLSARLADVPLATQLARRVLPAGTAASTVVATHALLLAADPAELREEAARARDEGFRAAKLKLGAAALADDVARARAARIGLGPDLRLRGDANGAWTGPQAAAALESLAEFDFDYVEQPVAPHEIAALARLCERSPVRVAVDESVATEEDALRLIASGAAAVYVLKPATLGGPARVLEIARMVQQSGAEVVFSHAFESAVGARHAVHCAAALGAQSAVHGLDTAGLFGNDVAPPIECERGEMRLAATPGIGVSP